jgi:4-amino-4-deoxy-L-arabinose transferase-like glycosyltransferase
LAREVNGLSRTGLARAAVIAIVLVRGFVLAATPLSFDEAYYWLWSKHLAAGYLDHPPLIAFLIRAGTALFGNTSIGVRALPWLLSAAATWAVWRTVMIFNGNSRAAAIAALMFNLMPMIAVEAGVATPDAPQIAAAALMLLFLAKLRQTGDGLWWIAVGIAAGFALLAKYTVFFLGAGILFWLVIARKQRRWFASIWPYLGAAVALVMFAPVVIWNAQHGWISFAMQFGRTANGSFTLRYIGEFLGGQLLLASPFIALLAVAGVAAAFQRFQNADLVLPACLVLPAVAYFLLHSLHGRVQGNWPSFLYPAVAVLAAMAYVRLGPKTSWVVRLTRWAAIPVAALLVAVVYGQALFGAVHLRDPVSRLLGYGMGPLVSDIETISAREHASAVVTTNYALTGWLSFYLDHGTPVIQLNERSRYLNEASPDPQNLRGPLIYVSQERNEEIDYLSQRFTHVVPLEHVLRTRNGAVLDRYVIFRLDGPKAAVLSYDTN